MWPASELTETIYPLSIWRGRFVLAAALTVSLLVAGCGASRPIASASRSQAQSAIDSEARSLARPAAGPVIARFDAQRNKGLDFAGNRGDPVFAVADGRVVHAGSELRSYGELLIIKHDDVYLTAYAHNSVLLVREGDRVTRGQIIARMGNTGTDRVKLHFEVRRKGEAVDPEPYLVGAGVSTTDTAPSPDRPGGKGESTASSGSGFAVTDKLIVTNAHVVSGCKSISVEDRGTARVRAIDKANDLALVELPSQPGVARLRDGRLRQGEQVTVVGFPFAGILGAGPQVTTGNVTALSGIGNDTRFIQISAAIQPGNSGGPVIDQSGNVVGVVVSKLGLKFAAVTGDLPQNLNFAISVDVLRGFLNANGVQYLAGAAGRPLSTADLVDVAKPFTSLVKCSQ